MSKYFASFLLVVFVMAPSAVAGDLTLFGGVQRPGDITLGTAGSAAGQLTDPGNFGVFGARINTSGGPIGFEHTLAYSPNFLDTRANAFIHSSNLVVGIPALPVRPYGTVGMGWVYAGGEGPASLGSKFAFNYGGGVKVDVLGNLGFRVDVRGYSIRSVESQTLNVLESSVGLLIGF